MNAAILRNQLIAEIQHIPENRLEELHNLLHFFRSTLNTPQQNIAENIVTDNLSVIELENEPFIGMWQDRSEMEDSTWWVRTMRQNEWS